MGHAQLQEAINVNSIAHHYLLHQECLDALTENTTFFVTIYYQNKRSSWERSHHFQCWAELAVCLSEFIFFNSYQFIARTLPTTVNSVSHWQSRHGCNFERYTAVNICCARYGVGPLSQGCTCKLVCVSAGAKLLLDLMKSARSRVSFL